MGVFIDVKAFDTDNGYQKKNVWEFLLIFRFAIFEVIKSTFRFAFYDFSF